MYEQLDPNGLRMIFNSCWAYGSMEGEKTRMAEQEQIMTNHVIAVTEFQIVVYIPA